MSKITRRDFLKTAGVMTLAVAAAGVLAGCEGNKPGEELPPVVTGNSVTVGDYTLTLNEAKLFSVKDYTSQTTEVASEKRFVVVMGNLKNNNESTKAPAFNLTFDNEGVTAHANNTVSIKGVKKLFDLTVDPIKWQEFGNFAQGGANAAVKNKTVNGTPVYWAYEVKSTKYADKTVVFETPKVCFVAQDTDNKVYTKINVAIPAAAVETTDKVLNAQ